MYCQSKYLNLSLTLYNYTSNIQIPFFYKCPRTLMPNRPSPRGPKSPRAQVLGLNFKYFGCIFSRERSSTGSNDCFVVLVVLVLVVVVFYPLVIFKSKSLFVPCCGTFCAFPWHISLKVFLCHIVAHGIMFPLVKNCK
jgi:hypothetical protein